MLADEVLKAVDVPLGLLERVSLPESLRRSPPLPVFHFQHNQAGLGAEHHKVRLIDVSATREEPSVADREVVREGRESVIDAPLA